MAPNISSAVPEQLIRYSEVTTEMDYALQSTARQLRSQLEYFEGQCSEPGIRLSTVSVADGLKNYADQCEPVDLWVKKVGQQFQLADSRWGIAGSGISGGWFAGVWASLSASLSAISAGARAGFVALLAIPDWLRGKVASLPWASKEYSEWMPDITKSIELRLSRIL